ncbi:uncharacterized protein VTP21DRAFT_5971 [Calcarisporiella thermophila]|uniref:uncharacterized protein n=1 Tax=Calcarisporiella thermophila TaxID=911321 RepID=UPI0037443537
MRRLLVLQLLLIFQHFLFASGGSSPPVQTWLQASWKSSDLLLELIESVTSENSTAFFPLLSILTEPATLAKCNTPKNTYQAVLEKVQEYQFITDATALDLLKLSVSLRTSAPLIQAQYHHYNATKREVDCGVWAEIGGKAVCEVEKIENMILENLEEGHSPRLFPFDHILKPSTIKASGQVVILYADIRAPEFHEYHTRLLKLVKENGISYVLRYKPARSSGTLYLQGYGVELTLKKTDYLVIDDRKVDSDDHSESSDHAHDTLSQDILFEDTGRPTIEPLLPAQIRDLGIKSTSFIVSSPNPLSAFLQLAQDFPKYQHKLAQQPLNGSTREEIGWNQHRAFYAGANIFWVNGVKLEAGRIDPFGIMEVMRKERKTLAALKALGVEPKRAIDLLAAVDSQNGQGETDNEEAFDVRDIAEGGGVITWWNDLERDARYKNWPSSLMELFRPMYPGQLSMIARNLFSVLFVVDLTRPEDLEPIVDDVQTMIKRGIPIRFGMVPIVDNSDAGSSTQMAKVFTHLLESYGRTVAMQFLSEFHRIKKESPSTVLEVALPKAFEAATKNQTPKETSKSLTLEEVYSHKAYADSVKRARAYMERLGILHGGRGVIFVNGRPLELDEAYQQQMVQMIGEQRQNLMQNIYIGKVKEDADVYEYFLTMPHVLPRRNRHIFAGEFKPLAVLDLALRPQLRDAMRRVKYLANVNADGDKINTTYWVVTDLETRQGQRLALEAIQFVESQEGLRLALLHRPRPHQGKKKKFASKIRDAATIQEAKELLEKAIEYDADALVMQSEQLHQPSTPDGSSVDGHQELLDAILDPKSDSSAIVINGRIVGPIPLNEAFHVDDFRLLDMIERKKRIEPILNALQSLDIKKMDATEYSVADFIAEISSIVMAAGIEDRPVGLFEEAKEGRKRPYTVARDAHSAFSVGDLDNAWFQVAVLIDPLSETAQKWATLLMTLSRIEGVHIQVFLNPNPALTELPLTRFFRYVFDSELKFDENGDTIAPSAYFANLPEEPLFTLGMDVPGAWLVMPVSSIHDLDNIKLDALDGRSRRRGVEATFELKHILVEGHCRDMTKHMPPRGLQFVLGGTVDTIVMANLGYMQLKANPGVWDLELREGRSRELYELESAGSEGWRSRGVDEIGNSIVLTSFDGITIYPRVRRRPGHEHDPLLVEGQEEGNTGLWNSIKSSIFGGKQKAPGSKNQTEINIFSVASGHLYERFLSIMIVSVMRHTKSTVKFWFIENFLSPSFKNFIPHMAQHYGFEYEMVTYKWPSWLRAQREKQRTIWGYKILFLDVLFPLDLEKVIFVDADQIVRTDLKELVDLDLKGAPYGYTPFCDNRKEIEGFRFWKHGYWKEHLSGKPYHISALYVVDLNRFRQLAAGDRLRGQYQMLSADPHSLSNLDQDLPNNMQHQVPIFSLPQDWLWCETWCSDESLKTAKTIDLCNNPMTKEPKLDRAKRLIPEWDEYDREVSRVALQAQQQSQAPQENGESAGEDGAMKQGETVGEKPDERATRPKDEL